MDIKLDEKTEVTLPLKAVIVLATVIVSAVAFKFHIEERITSLEKTIERRATAWDAGSKFVEEFKPHPQVAVNADRLRELEIIIVKQQKDIEYFKEQLNRVKPK